MAEANGNRPFRRLTPGSSVDYEPAWSHRGKIAFVRVLGGNHDIHTMNRDGSGLRRVTRTSAKDTSPSWSPDSQRIAFVRRGDVYTVKADGTALKRVTATGGLEPTFSPDGSKIAFSRGPARHREIYVGNAHDGRGAQRITSEPTDARDPDWQSAGHSPVIAGAGDIACDPMSRYFNGGWGVSTDCRQRHTSDQLLNMDLNRVVTLGDNQYSNGTLAKFHRSYEASWGTRRGLKRITAPSVGNHEYDTPGAAGYFDYFNGSGQFSGPAGDRDKGYYSYELGSWHVVVLNSNCRISGESGAVVGCGPGSPQHDWLANDLAAHPRRCTLAYFHHPRFALPPERFEDYFGVKPFWELLDAAGADLVLNGHAHTYERFAPMTPSGELDRERGIRQIIAGTGGKSLVPPRPGVPNREVADYTTYGVLKVTLRSGSYTWRLVPEAGAAFTDSGTTACH
ncbi:MAG: metallophosphoesterase [Actinobacteria bacterium]|nr:metallophosphoesterase [Actinomycetota bacterium]